MQVQQSDVFQLVSFEIAGEEFGVDILKVQEIIHVVDMTQVPSSPEFVEGVINLRGQIIPVINLRHRFGFPAREKDRQTRIVVVELASKTVGFLVDRVQEVLRVETTVIEPPPELVTNITTQYITGVAKLEGRLLILLDLDAVLSKEEQHALA